MEIISKIKAKKDLAKKFKSGSQVILLRHAESKSNQIKNRIRSIEHTEEDLIRVQTIVVYKKLTTVEKVSLSNNRFYEIRYSFFIEY